MKNVSLDVRKQDGYSAQRTTPPLTSVSVIKRYAITAISMQKRQIGGRNFLSELNG